MLPSSGLKSKESREQALHLECTPPNQRLTTLRATAMMLSVHDGNGTFSYF
jgi:hypothetical protein